VSVKPLTTYRYSSDLERRLESIAMICIKQRDAGQFPDMSFPAAARELGLHDEIVMGRIRQRVYGRWKTIRRMPGRCIFDEADRLGRIKSYGHNGSSA